MIGPDVRPRPASGTEVFNVDIVETRVAARGRLGAQNRLDILVDALDSPRPIAMPVSTDHAGLDANSRLTGVSSAAPGKPSSASGSPARARVAAPVGMVRGDRFVEQGTRPVHMIAALLQRRIGDYHIAQHQVGDDGRLLSVEHVGAGRERDGDTLVG